MRTTAFVGAFIGFVAVAMGGSLLRQKPATVVPVVDEAPMKAKSYDWLARHQAVLDRIKKGNVDIILVGDSITHMLGGDPNEGSPGRGQATWDKYFAPRHAVNLGFGWDKTQHVLWRFDHGEIDGISPKLATVMIGTNNLDSDSTQDIATGIAAVVDELQRKLPHTKILLLAIFPRGSSPTDPYRAKIAEVNKLIEPLGKRKGVTYLDIGSKFLEPDGSLSADIMPDFLHPSVKGYEIEGAALEPTVAKLFGDKPRS